MRCRRGSGALMTGGERPGMVASITGHNSRPWSEGRGSGRPPGPGRSHRPSRTPCGPGTGLPPGYQTLLRRRWRPGGLSPVDDVMTKISMPDRLAMGVRGGGEAGIGGRGTPLLSLTSVLPGGRASPLKPPSPPKRPSGQRNQDLPIPRRPSAKQTIYPARPIPRGRLWLPARRAWGLQVIRSPDTLDRATPRKAASARGGNPPPKRPVSGCLRAPDPGLCRATPSGPGV